MGRARETAGVADFLANHAAGWMTGRLIVADGARRVDLAPPPAAAAVAAP
jgi:hypothetical protein